MFLFRYMERVDKFFVSYFKHAHFFWRNSPILFFIWIIFERTRLLMVASFLHLIFKETIESAAISTRKCVKGVPRNTGQHLRIIINESNQRYFWIIRSHLQIRCSSVNVCDRNRIVFRINCSNNILSRTAFRGYNF